jgi:hypothetical protein
MCFCLILLFNVTFRGDKLGVVILIPHIGRPKKIATPLSSSVKYSLDIRDCEQ